MRFAFVSLFACLALGAAWAEPPSVLLLVGAGGNDQYAATFATAADNWAKAAAAGQARCTTLGRDPQQTNPREAFRDALQQEVAGKGDLWVVLLGHGTYDGREARFNARGDDFTAAELAQWLKPIERPTFVIATFSSSGGFLKPLAAPGRIVLTATRSGSEENYSRLGEFLAATIAEPRADIDQDGQTSLLEAWVTAAQRVTAFYKGEGRLATEDSLLDDSGDGFGTPADWFRGVRAVKKAQGKAIPDGVRAHQVHLVPNAAETALPPAVRAERDRLELELSALRERKAELPPEEYYRELEALLLKLAKVYVGAGD
jgi:hypothetical protein